MTVTVGWGSPLADIERAVQERAKNADLDMTAPGSTDALRALLELEVQHWQDEYRRGRRPVDIADPDRAVEVGLRNLSAFGPLQPLLDDPDVWEIMVNAPDSIFVRRHRGVSGYHDEVFHDDEHVARVLTRLLDEASGSHRKFDPAEGLQDAQLPTGARLHIVHSDIGRGGHLLINIRKFTGVAYRHLGELVDLDMLNARTASFLFSCVRSGLSLVVAGPPGAGKTTLMSCLAAELDPRLRVVIAEEVLESDVPLPNVAQLQTRPARADRPEIDLRRLVTGFMRMAPDVAVVGEVRDTGEAMPLLLCLSSGVQGMTTIHAGSGRQALSRLRFICQLSDQAAQISTPALTALVAEAVDVVVYCSRRGGVVRVAEVLAVEDLQVGSEAVAFTTTEIFSRPRYDAPLKWSGNLPVRATRALESAGYDIRALTEAPA